MLSEYRTSLANFSERFMMIENVGEGSYGSVSKAYDTFIHKIVALKQIVNLDNKEKAFHEANILRRLNHENINKLYDVVHLTSENKYFLVLEYCPYTLLSLINENALTLAQKKEIMRQILVALDYIQTQSVIHMDIKPANILLTENFTVKLADFGVSQIYDPEKPQSEPLLTYCYRPIELLLGKKSFGFEVDIWSAGVVFYQIMTGEFIFTSRNQENAVFISIMKILGNDRIEDWSEFTNLPGYSSITKSSRLPPLIDSKFSQSIKDNYGQIVDKIKLMLSKKPSMRPSAKALLDSGVFGSAPSSSTINSLKLNLEEMHKAYDSPPPCNSMKKSVSFEISRPYLPCPLVECC